MKKRIYVIVAILLAMLNHEHASNATVHKEVWYTNEYQQEAEMAVSEVNTVSIRSPTKDKCMPRVKPQKSKVGEEDVMNLARIICAENGSHKDDEALCLTGVVVLKRMKSDEYPDTILGVVSQKGQYATWMDGSFYHQPNRRSIKIAKKLLTTNLAEKYPDNLVFQAEFKQGREVYRKLGHEYFCLA